VPLSPIFEAALSVGEPPVTMASMGTFPPLETTPPVVIVPPIAVVPPVDAGFASLAPPFWETHPAPSWVQVDVFLELQFASRKQLAIEIQKGMNLDGDMLPRRWTALMIRLYF
jgi:hypothetical protein